MPCPLQELHSTGANLVLISAGLQGMIPYNLHEDLMVNLLTIRVQNNRLTQPVSPVFCDLDVNNGEYELVELAVDCAICPDDCSICKRKCY